MKNIGIIITYMACYSYGRSSISFELSKYVKKNKPWKNKKKVRIILPWRLLSVRHWRRIKQSFVRFKILPVLSCGNTKYMTKWPTWIMKNSDQIGTSSSHTFIFPSQAFLLKVWSKNTTIQCSVIDFAILLKI